jgi:ADP-ribose pyrophosphatase YjhB (NUDIX family)
VAVYKDDKILMVKKSIDDCWSMAGRCVFVKLSIGGNVVKEVKEEAGLNVVPKRMITVLDRNKHNEPVIA